MNEGDGRAIGEPGCVRARGGEKEEGRKAKVGCKARTVYFTLGTSRFIYSYENRIGIKMYLVQNSGQGPPNFTGRF